jgi:hypothetical protein
MAYTNIGFKFRNLPFSQSKIFSHFFMTILEKQNWNSFLSIAVISGM